MAISADCRPARSGKARDVDRMADAVAGPRQIKTVFLRDRRQIGVIIGIAKIGVEQIMVEIADGDFRLHPRYAIVSNAK